MLRVLKIGTGSQPKKKGFETIAVESSISSSNNNNKGTPVKTSNSGAVNTVNRLK